eukprot:34750-Pyramimonas_sp.AAC.1
MLTPAHSQPRLHLVCGHVLDTLLLDVGHPEAGSPADGPPLAEYVLLSPATAGPLWPPHQEGAGADHRSTKRR